MKNDIAVIGLGYVGLPLVLNAANNGYRVTGIDIDPNKVALLQTGKSPIKDPVVEDLLKRVSLDSVKFTSDFADLKSASIIIICVPTPVHQNRSPDLGPVKKSVEEIGSHLQPNQLIVLESTVNPGVSDEVVIPMLEEISGLTVGKDFYLAHCPERINPGDKQWTVENIPRVVGASDPVGLERAYNFYTSIIKAEIRKMGSLKEAEAVKIVENSFRDINIAFVNELAMSFSQLGIDVVNVINGAATKPFAFMAHYPSCGVGGHCIPVDPYYLIEYAEKNGFYHQFLSLARRINNHMPHFTVDQLILACNESKQVLNGETVAVLGLAYKPDIEDCRESPSFTIIKQLKTTGAKVRVFDPHVPQKQTVTSLEEALDGAIAVIIATAHSEFKSLTPAQFIDQGVKIIIDGCNCLPKEDFVKAGLVYRGIGR